MWLRIGVICILLLGVSAETSGDVRVTVAQGDVIGSRASDGDYFEFHGIPYADSTSGRNRFKAPTSPPLFNDVFVANRKDVKCVRALGIGYDGTEDCLVANVFTPTLDTTESLPVMVWIKGREFDLINAPDLSFTNFMRKDVVVVTLNYRESILGFLCLGTDIAPGNAGLKDIIAGLKWVRENIAQFGGDPENISLFGHGSGAAAVDLVSLSPMSTGLITKVITQSGNALSPWAVTRDNIRHAVEVAEALGHEVTNIIQLSEVFTRTSIAALMAVINELNLTDNSLAFAPCVENDNLESSDPFLLKSPYEILLNGEYTTVPFMTGFVDKEGTIRSAEALEDNWLEQMDESFADFLQSDLTFENEDVKLGVVEKIRDHYFDDQPISSTTINEFLSYHGDTMILVSTLREVRMRAAVTTSSIYLYQFSYKGYLGEPFTGPLPVDKVAHSEELGYLFRDYNNNETNDIDMAVSDILIERWTSFAKTGIPNSETSETPWRPFTRDNSSYIRILDSDEISSRQEGSLEIDLVDPHPETMTFWEEIYEQHFLDAEGRWDLTDRGEDDEDDENEVNGGEDGNEEDGGNENGGEDGGNGVDGEDGGNGGGDGGNEGDGADGGNEGSGEDGEIEGSGEDGENEGSGEDGESESSGEDGEDDDDGNSATTAVGYTFLITSLFAILGNLHMSHLVS